MIVIIYWIVELFFSAIIFEELCSSIAGVFLSDKEKKNVEHKYNGNSIMNTSFELNPILIFSLLYFKQFLIWMRIPKLSFVSSIAASAWFVLIVLREFFSLQHQMYMFIVKMFKLVLILEIFGKLLLCDVYSFLLKPFPALAKYLLWLASAFASLFAFCFNILFDLHKKNWRSNLHTDTGQTKNPRKFNKHFFSVYESLCHAFEHDALTNYHTIFVWL